MKSYLDMIFLLKIILNVHYIMSFYCLANTTVLGELLIQTNTVTYSATSSGFSSGSTFKDAEQAATIASNTAAIATTRALVNSILTKYSSVLADNVITSMINNSIKTDISPIIPIPLATIASTVDGINYILNKNVNVSQSEMVLVKDGQTLTIPAMYTLDGKGLLQVGDSNPSAKLGAHVKKLLDVSVTSILSININYSSALDFDGTEASAGVAFNNSGVITNSGVTTFRRTSCINTQTGQIYNTSTGSTLSVSV
jgi:hypothetical protein